MTGASPWSDERPRSSAHDTARFPRPATSLGAAAAPSVAITLGEPVRGGPGDPGRRRHGRLRGRGAVEPGPSAEPPAPTVTASVAPSVAASVGALPSGILFSAGLPSGSRVLGPL